MLRVESCITVLERPSSTGPRRHPTSNEQRLPCAALRACAPVLCGKQLSPYGRRFFTEVQAVFRASHRPIQPPPSSSSGNHREVIILEQTQMLKKEGMMEKKHYTKPPHVSNEYTPQLLALFCIFYIFTYTKYFQTSLCLFKTLSVTCLAEQIQCKHIHWMTLPCTGFKMHQGSKAASAEVNNKISQVSNGGRANSIILKYSPYSKGLQPNNLKMDEATLVKQGQPVH